MARPKAAKNVEIKPWLSARQDCREGRFVQVGNSLLLSEVVQDLSPGARWLYLALAMESGGRRDVVFTHGTGRKYGIAPSSFDRYAKELSARGFVERVGNPEGAQYAPNVFRFLLDWKAGSPPQNGEGKARNIPQNGEGRETLKV